MTVPYPLFIFITKWFLAMEWNTITIELFVGNEVTVHGEMTGKGVNTDSFWRLTTRVLGGDKYEVKNENG